MLSRLASAQREITSGIEGFAFQDSIAAGYGCAWNEFCDWWLEASKARLKAKDHTAQAIGLFCFETLLRLLHPFMPFVTEELWSRMPGHRDFVMRAGWPDELHQYVDGQAEVDFERLMSTVYEIRSYRKTVAGAPMKGGAARLSQPGDSDWERALAQIGEVAVVDELPPGKQLVVGGGPIGQLCCRLARHFGAGRVWLSEPSAERRSYAEASQVDRAFDPSVESAEIERLKALL